MLKILIVHNYYQIPGGEDTVVSNEKDLLQDNGNEVYLYTRNNSEINEMGILRKALLPLSTVFNIRTFLDVKALIKQKNIDIVHVHNTLNLISPSVYYAACFCRIPVVQTIHNFRLLCPGATLYRDNHVCEDCLDKGLGCSLKHKCYRGSFVQTLVCVINTKFHRLTGIYRRLNYICLTEFNKEKILNVPKVNPNKVFVKPNFVVAPSEVGALNDVQNNYIYAGRLDELKGIRVLLSAWCKMGKIAPKLIICGTGPLEDWCHKFVKDNGLSSVELRGFVPNNDVRELIAKAKALILPTQWYEGFPMSIVESFAVGTPVVCSNIGNAGSIIEEGITGAKFLHNSPEDLIAAVKRIEEYKSIRITTIEKYQKCYSQEVNYKQLLEIYRTVK